MHWPFPSSLDAIGVPYTAQGRIVENSRCLPITRGLAAEQAAELATGYERSVTAPTPTSPTAGRAARDRLDVAVQLLLLDQPVTGLDGGAW